MWLPVTVRVVPVGETLPVDVVPSPQFQTEVWLLPSKFVTLALAAIAVLTAVGARGAVVAPTLGASFCAVSGPGGVPWTTSWLLLLSPPATVKFVAVLPRLKLMVSPAQVNCADDRVRTFEPGGALTI